MADRFAVRGFDAFSSLQMLQDKTPTPSFRSEVLPLLAEVAFAKQ
jgi:hypothetical protein